MSTGSTAMAGAGLLRDKADDPGEPVGDHFASCARSISKVASIPPARFSFPSFRSFLSP
ncbi:MAG: hypothetical protein H7343_09215 [Undibacterium sp.]|nr:hypothetical protein [Opitutaceae bacterium]